MFRQLTNLSTKDDIDNFVKKNSLTTIQFELKALAIEIHTASKRIKSLGKPCLHLARIEKGSACHSTKKNAQETKRAAEASRQINETQAKIDAQKQIRSELAIQVSQLEAAMSAKKENLTFNEAYDYLKDQINIYTQQSEYSYELGRAARSLLYEYEGNEDAYAVKVLVTAADILVNNSTENRARFSQLFDVYEDKDAKHNRKVGAAALFLGVALFLGAIAVAMTGVGALPALFVLVVSLSVLGTGLYIFAENERSYVEGQMKNFNDTAKQGFFGHPENRFKKYESDATLTPPKTI